MLAATSPSSNAVTVTVAVPAATPVKVTELVVAEVGVMIPAGETDQE